MSRDGGVACLRGEDYYGSLRLLQERRCEGHELESGSDVKIHHLVPLEHVGLVYVLLLNVTVAHDEPVKSASEFVQCLSEFLLCLIGLSQIEVYGNQVLQNSSLLDLESLVEL